jgi:aspartyl-tRNA(Asn)/glutamyl-tRNA(Gln) amidotransferase subunit C
LSIDEGEVRRIARLARLDPDDPAVERLRRELQSILDHVAMLDELDFTEEPAMPAPGGTGRPLRSDDPRPGLASGRAVANAPDTDSDQFRVPRILER